MSRVRLWGLVSVPMLLLSHGLSSVSSELDRSARRSFVAAADSDVFIRVNQVGYTPGSSKVAVVCGLHSRAGEVNDPRTAVKTFTVETEAGRKVFGPAKASASGAFGPCTETWRLDFTALRTAGRYRVRVDTHTSPVIRIGEDVYAGLADTLMSYMRQQRSGYNPFLRDSAHKRDGFIVDHPTRTGEFLNVSGGWADAADYLQYVTTSATATYHLLASWRDAPLAFGDAHDNRGLPGRNGTPDVLDEARHGLLWLLRMFPDDSTMFNQLGDDRDHAFWDLITTDSSDYGWGKGRERPIYPCTGKPQGILKSKNRADGYASTAGKMAAAFALGSQVFATRDAALADTLRRKAIAAYRLGEKYPGVCQTAPGSSPYFYEEDNWVDDMELGASFLHQLTGERRYLDEAMRYARREPVTPWMGADTANHYQWYPFHNAGHFESSRSATTNGKRELAGFYRDGLTRVASRAQNGFRIGIPFIWCSNDLLVSFANQAMLYERMTGDRKFEPFAQAALDWIFGTNPWGTSMVIGVPRAGVWPRDPHTELPDSLHHGITGGLVDGPVYRSIYAGLKGIRLLHEDEFARFNTGFIVYHDDLGDYSTNEHIMDGTANLAYLLAMRHPRNRR